MLSRWLGCFTVDWQLACFSALDFKRLCNYLLLRTALWSLIFNLTKRCLEPGASAEVKLARSLKSIDNLFIQKFYLFKNLKPEMLIILIHSNICENLKTSVGFIFDSDMFFSDQINSVSKSILSFSHPKHPSSSSFTSFYSHSSWKFIYIQQLYYCDSLYSAHLTRKSQQTSKYSKLIGTCHYEQFQILTHHTSDTTGTDTQNILHCFQSRID